MDRRQFGIALLLAGLTKAARAQRTKKIYRIAIVSPVPFVAADRAFMEELRRLGYIEGQLLVDHYWTERGALHDPELAQEVVRRSPDVIFAVSNPFVQDFKAATTTIPIVGVTADPVSLGIVSSLAHPGGNITGINRTLPPGYRRWLSRAQSS